jgi:DNA-binding Xre family transcriptional regulator
MKTINYKKLWILLLERNITKQNFREMCSISTGTMTKLNKNQEVALSVIVKICNTLDCDVADICEVV